MNEPSAELLRHFQQGHHDAAEAIFSRYVERLTRLARSGLSAKVARRVDAEDVVLSAYRSFFLGAREGRFTLQRSGDLWRLLVAITLNKLHRQVKRQTAAKRSVNLEHSMHAAGTSAAATNALAREPSAADALAAADELEHLMSGLTPLKRRILELRLQDAPLDEIACDTGRSERTIRRLLNDLRGVLERRLLEERTDG